MSYVRWGSGGSDVYVYYSTEDVYVCCSCRFQKKVKTIWSKNCSKCKGKGCDECMMGSDFQCETIPEMIQHLQKHLQEGDCVPLFAFENLEKEI